MSATKNKFIILPVCDIPGVILTCKAKCQIMTSQWTCSLKPKGSYIFGYPDTWMIMEICHPGSSFGLCASTINKWNMARVTFSFYVEC